MKGRNKVMKGIHFFQTILYLVIGVTVSYSQKKLNEGVCVMRSDCFGANPCNDKREPIILKPIQENIRSLSLLEAMCPELHQREDPAVCCDDIQLESMFVTLYNLAHLGYNHCPSCLKNLEKLFCQMTCSPQQNQFISVKKLKNNRNQTEVNYHLNELYAKGIFESCKSVRSFEGRVIDSMCGELKGEECLFKDWFQTMGAQIQETGISPFRINFHFTKEKSVKVENNSFKPLNEKYIKCSEKANKELNACDCHHCPDSCPKSRKKRGSEKCLMKGICGETAFGAIPCVTDEGPSPISNPIALQELKEMCPHLATSDNPSVCCTEEQIIRLNQTFEMVSMFLRECPSCVRNFEKVICHLSCGTDQQNFMKITKSEPNESGQQMVSEVNYWVNDDWIKGVYDSCKGVHRLGFNVLNHYCKPYKANNCNHQKFMQFIGGNAEHFGHNSYEINFMFSNEETVQSDGIPYKPVKQSFYKCSENPHTKEGVCPCTHCDESCASGMVKNIIKELPKYNGRQRREIKIGNNFDGQEFPDFDDEI